MKKKEKDIRNRPYASSKEHSLYEASTLFERAPSQEYIEEWTESLLQALSETPKDILSVMVFRIGQEWLALPTVYFKEVTVRRLVHPLPHKNNKILQGVVNLNGELKLYVALDQLLEIESTAYPPRYPYQEDRMMAIAKEGDLWVFPVDEIDGIYHWEDLSSLENVPVNVSKSKADYLKGIMKIGNKSIGLLDEELLFASLKRSVQ